MLMKKAYMITAGENGWEVWREGRECGRAARRDKQAHSCSNCRRAHAKHPNPGLSIERFSSRQAQLCEQEKEAHASIISAPISNPIHPVGGNISPTPSPFPPPTYQYK